MCKLISCGIIHENTNLKKLIAENPDLPIVVLAGEYANSGDYGWEYCRYVECKISEILDCDTPFKNYDHVYSERDEFEEDLVSYLANRCEELTDEEFSELLKAEIARYEPHWKKVIAVFADNI